MTDYIKTHIPQAEDLVVWPDGTTCHYDELSEYSHMSDDYQIVPHEDNVLPVVINTGYVPEFMKRHSPIDWCSSDLR